MAINVDEEFSKRRLQIATFAARLGFFRTGSLVFSPLPCGQAYIFSVRSVGDYIQSEG
jgi:hypothetical protein